MITGTLVFVYFVFMILSMAKRKNTTSTSASTHSNVAAKSDSMLTWSTAMNDNLIEAVLRQQEMENRVDNTFTFYVYRYIVVEMT